MKLFFRAGLICALPFIAYFPAVRLPLPSLVVPTLFKSQSRSRFRTQAILMYWTTNNALSLLQAFILRTPSVRTLLHIPLLPKKALVGEPGYVAEPSFGEAFKAMQDGMRDKWDETRDKADAQREAKDAQAREDAPAQVYVPRAPMRRRGEVERVADSLVESVAAPSGRGEIVARSRKDEEKAKRVLKARLRRQ